MEKDLIILGLESSCDETACAITKNGKLLANVISSQIEVHQKFGGVMPEIASRLHLENIACVVDEALKTSGISRTLIGTILIIITTASLVLIIFGVKGKKGNGRK